MNRRWIAVAIVLLLAPLTFGMWQLSRARDFQTFGELVSHVPTSDKFVALTFDDGPTARHTESTLSVLRERNVRATFFVTGRESENNLEFAKKIVADGHELGNHSYSHRRMIFTTPSQVRDEIERTDAAIRNAGHQGDIHFRPPYGHKLVALPWYLSKNDRVTITWNIEPESYADVASSAERIARHVIENVQPGSIILLHVMYDSREESRKAIPLVIDGVRERGYRFVTVSELLASRRDNHTSAICYFQSIAACMRSATRSASMTSSAITAMPPFLVGTSTP